MKNIMVIRLSEDGICDTAFTNVKALYDWIGNELTNQGAYKPISLDSDFGELKYNYPNLVKQIKERLKLNRFTLAYLECEGGSTIEVNNVCVISKY